MVQNLIQHFQMYMGQAQMLPTTYGTNTVFSVCESAKQFLEIWTNFKCQSLRCLEFSHHFKKCFYYTNMQIT